MDGEKLRRMGRRRMGGPRSSCSLVVMQHSELHRRQGIHTVLLLSQGVRGWGSHAVGDLGVPAYTVGDVHIPLPSEPTLLSGEACIMQKGRHETDELPDR